MVVQRITALMLACVPLASIANGGMLLVSEINQKPHVLMVEANSKDYFVFPGGKEESGADLITREEVQESIYETALRETTEETRGYIGRQQLLLASSEKNYIEASKHTLFLARLPYFSADNIRKIKMPRGKKWSPMQEIKNYAWVSIEAIANQQNLTVTDSEGHQIQLHPIIPAVIDIGKSKRWF